jgi:hypothetical protein
MSSQRLGLVLALSLAAGACAAPWVIELRALNGQGETRSVRFGVHPDASEGLDPDLGEQNLPPWPPSEMFDLRWLPSGLEGLLLDLRADRPGVIDWLLGWQTGGGGPPVRLEWDSRALPAAGEFRLSDPWGGSVVPPVDMRTDSVLTVTNPVLRRLVLRATLPDRPAAVQDFAIQASAPGLRFSWSAVDTSLAGAPLSDVWYILERTLLFGEPWSVVDSTQQCLLQRVDGAGAAWFRLRVSADPPPR